MFVLFVFFFFFLLCCFFQAEDGIRDLVRSRGLGDVYKRQGHRRAMLERGAGLYGVQRGYEWTSEIDAFDGQEAVSYTHLTLPTSDLV